MYSEIQKKKKITKILNLHCFFFSWNIFKCRIWPFRNATNFWTKFVFIFKGKRIGIKQQQYLICGTEYYRQKQPQIVDDIDDTFMDISWTGLTELTNDFFFSNTHTHTHKYIHKKRNETKLKSKMNPFHLLNINITYINITLYKMYYFYMWWFVKYPY